jgi:hypothetical protein
VGQGAVLIDASRPLDRVVDEILFALEATP